MTDMQRFEKAAIVILIVWVVTLIPNRLHVWSLVALFSSSPEAVAQLSYLTKVIGLMHGVTTGAVTIAVAIWMFLQARRDGAARWVWMLFGLAFGLMAPVLYFLLQLIQELRSVRNMKQDGQAVNAHNG
ncbi:MAG: hypothetical protein PHR35_14255 [Kiritimatiellae bacterium]|nr:hypothetical protein [Kiritimatiellia bacterium]